MTRRAAAAPAPPAAPVVAVAFSGGRDSLALLHATCRAAQVLGLQVAALHVHHGLLPEADDWLLRARRLCARWRRRGWPVQLHSERLTARPGAGDSPEAWARRERYAALARLARAAGAELVLLAHHLQDQAETVLLQALRGAGPAGLAAMPRSATRGGITWARPWLAQPPAGIDAYVRRHRLKPVQDPSNHDPALARSRLRQQVWPALVQAFPQSPLALAAVAARAHEADAALVDLAAIDLAGCCTADGGLRAAAWRGLPPARQAIALRAWWQRAAGQGMPGALLARLLAELPQDDERKVSRWPADAGHWLRLHRGVLRRVPTTDASAGVPTTDASAGVPTLVPVRDGGLTEAQLAGAVWRPRQGGEQFQAAAHRPPRSLKKQYQAAGIAADARQGPLLWSADGQLLWVPGLGVDHRQRAPAGAPQWLPVPVSGPHKPAA